MDDCPLVLGGWRLSAQVGKLDKHVCYSLVLHFLSRETICLLNFWPSEVSAMCSWVIIKIAKLNSCTNQNSNDS